jgi:hypothetical protein
MNIQYMLDHGDELYDAISKDIHDMFDNLACNMEAEMAGNLVKIHKLILSSLGRTCNSFSICNSLFRSDYILFPSIWKASKY